MGYEDVWTRDNVSSPMPKVKKVFTLNRRGYLRLKVNTEVFT